MKRAELLFVVFGIMAIMTTIFLPACGACDRPTKSVEALENQGFTDIVLEGHRFFGCGKGEGSSMAFKAKNPNGKEVHGLVCCGVVGKGCTVRW